MTTDLLAERYGSRRPVRRRVLIGTCVLLAAVGLGWLGWAAWVNTDVAVRGEIVAFDVRGPHQVRAVVQVRVRDRTTTGACLLRAKAEDFAVVGESTMAVDGRKSAQQVVTVRTERRATTVEVVRCSGR